VVQVQGWAIGNKTPRRVAFCAHAILGNEILEVPDSKQDERFCDNPLTDDPGIRFYAGAPLVAFNGENMGTLCVMDTQPGRLSESQKHALSLLADQVVNQIELREAQATANVALKSKSLFLANISHEIRSPIAVLTSAIRILADRNSGEEDRQLLELMDQACENLLRLIDDVLDLSRAEAGYLAIKHMPFNPCVTAQNVVEMAAEAAADRGVSLQLRTDAPTSLLLMGDEVRVRQILFNLLSNAIKYAQSRITIDLTTTGQQGETRLQIRVTDDGPGIAAEDQERVFASFEQVRSDDGQDAEGSGLGLAISLKLAEVMEGSLELRSAEGRGASFTLELPLTPVEAAAEYGTAEPVENIQASAKKDRALRILVAEDSRANQQIISILLRSRDHLVDLVENGEQAVKAAVETPYDVILMDMRMPVLDGLEATRAIRQSAAHQPVILALTANAFDSDRDRCLESGMDGFLTKPLNVDELDRQLVMLLS
jgi:signal transduction histidine kinase